MDYKEFPEIKEQNKYTNVELWKTNNILGDGIVVWNTESPSDHGLTTTRRVWDAAPNSTILQACLSMYTKNGKVVATCEYNGQDYDVEDFIKTFNVRFVTRSVGGGTAEDTLESRYWNDLKKKYNLVFYNSAGNDGSDGCGGSLPPDVAIYVCAVNLVKGKPVRPFYSSIGEQNDFATFTGIWTGTSYAAPYLCGMSALILEKYHKNMTQDEIVKFLKMISKDLEESGCDAKSGWGLPILPTLDKTYITMTTKSNQYIVNNQIKTMDCVPVNKEGTVFVPLRTIGESLGFEIEVSFNKDKSIHIVMTKDGNEVIVNTGSDIMYINGSKLLLNFPPYIDENNRTLIPVRAISEAFNAKVDWIQKESRVMILG